MRLVGSYLNNEVQAKKFNYDERTNKFYIFSGTKRCMFNELFMQFESYECL